MTRWACWITSGGRAHVVGVSMGGMIAQEVAIHHPDRVLSLTSMMSTTGSRKVGWVAPRILARMFAACRPARRPTSSAAWPAIDASARGGSCRRPPTPGGPGAAHYRRGLNPRAHAADLGDRGLPDALRRWGTSGCPPW